MSSNQYKYEQIYDISVLLGVESVKSPFAPYSMETAEKAMGNDVFNSSCLTMSAHTGTHVDAPHHLARYPKTIDQYPLKDFILPALVVSIEDKNSIRQAELESLDINQGDAILFKTDNSISGKSTSGIFYKKGFVYMSVEAAKFCAKKKVKLVGIDIYGPENPKSESGAVHDILFANDILIMESINLKDVPPGRYTLFCLPLKIKNCEASPVRAILIG